MFHSLLTFFSILSFAWPFFVLVMLDAHKKNRIRPFLFSLAVICVSFFCCGVRITLAVTSDTRSIGAYEEEDEYDRDYSALVYADGDEEHPIFAIAEIRCFEGDYSLNKLKLPYGRSLYLDCEFERGKDISFYLDSYYTVQLNQPATKADYQLLESMVVNSDGFFHGDFDSDVYHTRDCFLCDEIKRSKLVYFKSVAQAELFLFTPCEICDPLMYA